MHLKYRPDNLDDVLGNEQIKKFLSVTYNYKNHIFFEGDRGTGKTTLAHIVAKRFGAPEENIQDINCQHVSGVNAMRDTVNELSRSSLFGSKKVIILDEVHKLSKEAETELLKPLEETKFLGKVLIIGCTTTIGKLEKAFLDRFIRLRTAPISNRESLYLISKVCKQEDISIPKKIKALLVEYSGGNPRNILVNISKVKDLVDEEEVKYMLDVSSIEENGEVFELFKLVTNANKKGVTWNIIANLTKKVIKTNNPMSVKIALSNILTNKLTSSYLSGNTEGRKLVNFYDNLRSMDLPNTEKSGLITAIYKSYLEFGDIDA